MVTSTALELFYLRGKRNARAFPVNVADKLCFSLALGTGVEVRASILSGRPWRLADTDA
jgi:hypothetical protein